MKRRLGTFLLVFGLAAASSVGVASAKNIAGVGDMSNPPGGLRSDAVVASMIADPANGIGLLTPLGDTQYECGMLADFKAAYDTTYGVLKPITMAATGNHEFLTTCTVAAGKAEAAEEELTESRGPLSLQAQSAADFFEYFGDRACPPPGWCSFNFQGWHFTIINTTFGALTESQRVAQLKWFKNDLASDNSRCQVVYGHAPYKATASPFTGTLELRDYWPSMVLDDVEMYWSGHNHSYERSAEFRTAGNVDVDWGSGDGDDGHAGVRQMVVGTGGRSLIGFSGTPPSSSRYRLSGHYGFLKLVPDYPATGKWIQAFKGADGTTYDRVGGDCRP